MEREISPEERKMQMEAQIDLMKTYLQSRHQTVINIALMSISIIAVAGLIEPSRSLALGVGGVLFLCVVILWYDIIVTRRAIGRSEEILNEILGQSYEIEVEKIKARQPWYMSNFQEIVGVLFTIIVTYFLIILLCDNKINTQHTSNSSNHHKNLNTMDRPQFYWKSS